MTTPRLAAKIPLFQANPKPPLGAGFLRGVSEGGTWCVRFLGSVIAKSSGLKDDYAVTLKLLLVFLLVFAKEGRCWRLRLSRLQPLDLYVGIIKVVVGLFELGLVCGDNLGIRCNGRCICLLYTSPSPRD